MLTRAHDPEEYLARVLPYRELHPRALTCTRLRKLTEYYV